RVALRFAVRSTVATQYQGGDGHDGCDEGPGALRAARRKDDRSDGPVGGSQPARAPRARGAGLDDGQGTRAALRRSSTRWSRVAARRPVVDDALAGRLEGRERSCCLVPEAHGRWRERDT